MKLQLVNVLKKVSLLCAILLATVFTSVHAQSPSNRVTAQIPFDFSVGDRKLPSGKYSFGRVRTNSDDLVLTIDDETGHSKAIHTSISVRNLDLTENAKLVFHRSDAHFEFQRRAVVKGTIAQGGAQLELIAIRALAGIAFVEMSLDR